MLVASETFGSGMSDIRIDRVVAIDLIERLARAMEHRDIETSGHVRRVAEYSRIIAERLGLNHQEVDSIFLGAPMHDIGKIMVPEIVLWKPRHVPLSDGDWYYIRKHPEEGYQILNDTSFDLQRVAAMIAYTHHEKWDGSGYPRKLSGEDIPIEGRIVAVADVFDALTSARVYKDAWPVERALGQIRSDAGSQFDPAIVSAMMASIEAILDIKSTNLDGALPERK